MRLASIAAAAAFLASSALAEPVAYLTKLRAGPHALSRKWEEAFAREGRAPSFNVRLILGCTHAELSHESDFGILNRDSSVAILGLYDDFKIFGDDWTNDVAAMEDAGSGLEITAASDEWIDTTEYFRVGLGEERTVVDLEASADLDLMNDASVLLPWENLRDYCSSEPFDRGTLKLMLAVEDDFPWLPDDTPQCRRIRSGFILGSLSYFDVVYPKIVYAAERVARRFQNDTANGIISTTDPNEGFVIQKVMGRFNDNETWGPESEIEATLLIHWKNPLTQF